MVALAWCLTLGLEGGHWAVFDAERTAGIEAEIIGGSRLQVAQLGRDAALACRCRSHFDTQGVAVVFADDRLLYDYSPSFP